MSIHGTDQDGWRGDLDEAAVLFLDRRPRLFAIAYRILGNVCEAEDVLQEVWLRWQATDRTVVLNPSAFLATMTSRLAINVVQSARSRHETLDPGFADAGGQERDPADAVENAEAVELAVLVLLERLTASERAAYVLREAFDYPYHRIAEILHLRAANTRQLVKRARDGVVSQRRRPVTSVTHRRLHQAFVSAATTGRLGDLETLLAAEVAH